MSITLFIVVITASVSSGQSKSNSAVTKKTDCMLDRVKLHNVVYFTSLVVGEEYSLMTP
jgi:hypothetical protein